MPRYHEPSMTTEREAAITASTVEKRAKYQVKQEDEERRERQQQTIEVKSADGLTVAKRSTIPGIKTPYGLFALVDIDENVIIGKYPGDLIRESRFKCLTKEVHDRASWYAMRTSLQHGSTERYLLDPTDKDGNFSLTPDTVIACINEAPPDTLHNAIPMNLPATHGTLEFTTIRKVLAGEELFTEYWPYRKRDYPIKPFDYVEHMQKIMKEPTNYVLPAPSSSLSLSSSPPSPSSFAV
jgi:hypothetical protein